MYPFTIYPCRNVRIWECVLVGLPLSRRVSGPVVVVLKYEYHCQLPVPLVDTSKEAQLYWLCCRVEVRQDGMSTSTSTSTSTPVPILVLSIVVVLVVVIVLVLALQLILLLVLLLVLVLVLELVLALAPALALAPKPCICS
jgi:hypothetical protein